MDPPRSTPTSPARAWPSATWCQIYAGRSEMMLLGSSGVLRSADEVVVATLGCKMSEGGKEVGRIFRLYKPEPRNASLRARRRTDVLLQALCVMRISVALRRALSAGKGAHHPPHSASAIPCTTFPYLRCPLASRLSDVVELSARGLVGLGKCLSLASVRNGSTKEYLQTAVRPVAKRGSTLITPP